jgi:8-oxo-dGTP diphosphatase
MGDKEQVGITIDRPIRVAAAIIEKDRRILIAKRKAGRFAGKWEFPGGKVESGETPEECLKRELREELGVDARVGELLLANVHEYSHITIELMAFRAEIVSGNLTLHDHSEVKWVAPEDLGLHEFPHADRPIIEKLVTESRTASIS